MAPKTTSQNSENTPSEVRKRDFSYCREMEQHFLELCLREVNVEGHRGVSLTSDSWGRLKKEFCKKWKVDYDHKKIRNHYDQLRGDYELWRKMVGLSGHGFSEDTNTLLCPSEKWKEVIQQYPKAGKFRKKPLEDIDTHKSIFEGTLVKGEVSWGPVSSNPRPSTSHLEVEEVTKVVDDIHLENIEENQSDEFFEGVTISDLTDTDSVHPPKSTSRRSDKKRKRSSTSDALDQQIENFVDILKEQISKEEASKGPSLADVIAVLKDLKRLQVITQCQFLEAKVLFVEKPDMKIDFMKSENEREKVEFLEFVLDR